jgi:hypothetical protein
LGKVGTENTHRFTQNAENGFGFNFLKRYHKDGDEFLSRVVRVTGDETWVSFVNVEIKGIQRSEFTHFHQTSRKSLEKRCLPETDGNSFLGQERSADGGIHTKRDNINVTNVLRNTKKTCVGHSEQMAWYADIRCSAST